MKEITLFILWDDIDGYKHRKIYLDHKSAEIGLKEQYTDYFIQTKRAKIEEITGISYIRD